LVAAHYGSRAGRQTAPYLSGREVDEHGRFRGSLGIYQEPKGANYYIEEYFGEGVLLRPSQVLSVFLILLMFAAGYMGVMI
jgi:hypothetical protein